MPPTTSTTLTFLFTDIEGSTRLLRALGEEYAAALHEHDRIIVAAATAHGGRRFGSEGDAQHVVFEDAGAAVAAAAEMQRGLATQAWPAAQPFRVRMGLHSGGARQDGNDYVGLVLHETARIADAGHGGQVLLSPATVQLVGDALPTGVTLRDLGEHRFKDVETPWRISQLEIDGLPAEFPPLRSRPVAQVRLPPQLTSFVGRSEVEAVVGLLDGARLVTLTGPGGTGKTRLSIAVAEQVADGFEDGVWFVALDAVTDADVVASEIVTTLGLSTGSGEPLQVLLGHLQQRAVLLVLDNLEQVISVGPDIARLVTECPRLAVIASSRIPLGVYGEQEFPVPALAVPPPGGDGMDAASLGRYASIRLLEDRARAVRPSFRIDDDNAGAAAEVVTRLDGLPLAIELAAARLRMLSLAALRRRLDDTLGTLSRGGDDRPTRQQTLRGAIAWSHDLLDAPDRRLFARFGVIAGSAGLEQIEAIVGPADEIGRDVFDGLESLTQQSLLRTEEGADGEPRFGMLVTIREFAREQLAASGEAETIHRRHAETFLALAEDIAPRSTGADAARQNEQLEQDHDDLRAALAWVDEHAAVTLGLRLVVALWRFWQVRGHLDEASERIRRVLAMPGVDDAEPALLAKAHSAAGSIAYWQDDRPTTHRHYAAALEQARLADDPALLAEALSNMGYAASDRPMTIPERFAEGTPWFEQALAAYRELGDRAGEASALWALHQAYEGAGDVARSIEVAREVLAIAREIDDRFRIGWSAYTLGYALALHGETSEAFELLEESLGVFAEAGDRSGVLLNVGTMALTAISWDLQPSDSWRLLGAAIRIREETGADLLNKGLDQEGRPIRWDPETPEERAAYARGRSMSDGEAIELARSLAHDIRRGQAQGA
jgi:predicted ATPase/class 3 adenylate cyclase